MDGQTDGRTDDAQTGRHKHNSRAVVHCCLAHCFGVFCPGTASYYLVVVVFVRIIDVKNGF